MSDICEPDADLLRLAESTTRRISSVRHDGNLYWVKRPETLKPRMRMQKGSPDAAFERERVALRKLNAMGAPVPRLIIDSPRLIVTEHCGSDLLRLRRNRKSTDVKPQFFAGGQVLAGLHGLGHTHGRPALKDMCWRDGKITIIDFERSRPSLDHPRGRARDVVLLFINALAAMKGVVPEIDALRDGYRAADEDGVWDGALRWSHNLTWMSWATRPLHLLSLPIREVRTLAVARDYFRDQRALRRAE